MGKSLGIGTSEAMRKYRRLLEEHFFFPFTRFKHLPRTILRWIYAKGEKKQIDYISNVFTAFPRSELYRSKDYLIGIVGIPPNWDQNLSRSMEKLSETGLEIIYVPYDEQSWYQLYIPLRTFYLGKDEYFGHRWKTI